MSFHRWGAALSAAVFLFFAGIACATTSELAVRLKTLASIDGAKIADPDASDWLSNGRDYREQRFSPLALINTKNVAKLGVAWEFRTFSTRALEASPIVA